MEGPKSVRHNKQDLVMNWLQRLDEKEFPGLWLGSLVGNIKHVIFLACDKGKV